MRTTALTVALAFVTVGALAQAPPAPKPGPEQQRMGYFAGKWTFEGEAKESPMGPAGKIKATESCSWFAGGFHLVCMTDGTGPKGASKGQSIMGYDPMEKTYTYYAISSMGDGFFVRGNVSGKVWTWNADMKTPDGKGMTIRATVTEETPTSYSFKLEGGPTGGPLTVAEEGKATKMK